MDTGTDLRRLVLNREIAPRRLPCERMTARKATVTKSLAKFSVMEGNQRVLRVDARYLAKS